MASPPGPTLWRMTALELSTFWLRDEKLTPDSEVLNTGVPVDCTAIDMEFPELIICPVTLTSLFSGIWLTIEVVPAVEDIVEVGDVGASRAFVGGGMCSVKSTSTVCLVVGSVPWRELPHTDQHMLSNKLL